MTDPTSLVGLRTLMREDPVAWPTKLAQGRGTYRGNDVGGLLRSGLFGGLIPRGPDDQKFREHRAIVSRWMPILDALDIRAIDERTLRRILVDGRDARVVGSQSRWKKDASFLRRLLRDLQLARLGRTRLAEKWRRIPPFPSAHGGPGHLPTLRDVQLLLSRAATRREGGELRVAIALALGGRLTSAEIVELRLEDLDELGGVVRVRIGCRRGRPAATCARDVPLPRFCWDLIRDLPHWGRPIGWLFTHRGDPSHQARDLPGRLRRLSPPLLGESVTLGDIRRLGQAIMRAANGSRGAVRGVVRDDRRRAGGEQTRFYQDQLWLAERWTRLMAPPADPVRLPRRAPKGCAVVEPERAAAKRRVQRLRARAEASVSALPRSCGGSAERPPWEVTVMADRRGRSTPDMGRDGTTSEQTAPSVDQAELARALKRIERLKGDVAVSAIAAMGAGFLLRGWVDANDVQTVSMEDVRARLMALIKPQR